MKRKILQLLVVTGLLTLAVANAGPLLLHPAAAQGEEADLYIKDTPMDTGAEPNPDTGPMWVTEDVWVRTTPDPNYQPYPFPEASPPWTPLPHQNPEYRDPKLGVPNYVYVRVRNRGTAASSGNERLRLYWAKASTGLSWPTQWVDYVVGSTLTGMEVTKPRKNAATATAAERAAYRDAIVDIGTLPAYIFSGGSSYWHKQDEVHQSGPTNRHGSPAFLPWHREMLSRYEILLQEADPTVRLLYWDWTTDPENSTGGFNFFTSSFMGASGRGTGGTSIGGPFLPSLSPPAVTRNLSTSTIPPPVADSTLIGSGPFQTFAPTLEGSPNHNSSHGYIGGGGNMSYISSAAEDPFFFLLHGNVDRLWAQWQRDPASLSRLDPATAYDTNSANVNITTMMAPWDGTGTPIEPYTVAGGYIVSKGPKHPSVVAPPIYDTAPLVVPVLQPGEAVVIQIPWYPPNPADFASFGADKNHFCLLARIETSSSSPFGMAFAEGANVYGNTKNNNNIAWKNLTVVDTFPGALQISDIIIRNVFEKLVPVGIRFANTDEIGNSFFDFGRIVVDLGQELYDRWQEAGGAGQGIEPLGGTRLEIFSPDAFVEGIPIQPGEQFSIQVQFELAGDYQLPRGVTPKWDLIQYGAPDDPDAIIGGQRFEIDFAKLVLVPAGAGWRYLDDGSDPGPGWNELDFDDAEWKEGPAELGFGDNPVTTVDGGPAGERHLTLYFRHTFQVTDPGFYRSLLLRLLRDDGAVVYLNGTEVHRVNLPEGEITPETVATVDVSGLEEELYHSIPLAEALQLLQEGENVIAAEIHQHSPRSPDLSFDLELSANHVSPQAPPDVAVVDPIEGALFQLGQPIPIAVEALDGDGEVVEVSLFAGGETLGTAGEPPFLFLWEGAPLGVHLLRAEARDDDGLRSVADLRISVVDNTPPVVAVLGNLDHLVFDFGQTIRIMADASDPGGAIQSVDFFLRDGDLFADVDELVGSFDSLPYTLELNGLLPGEYMLKVIARDDQGLTGAALPIHFEVSRPENSLLLPLLRVR